VQYTPIADPDEIKLLLSHFLCAQRPLLLVACHGPERAPKKATATENDHTKVRDEAEALGALYHKMAVFADSIAGQRFRWMDNGDFVWTFDRLLTF